MHGSAHRLNQVIGEFQRRRVFRVATIYIVAALGVVYAADVILPRLSAPDWTVAAVIVLAGLGWFVAVALAWAFDVTPHGLERTGPIPAPAMGAEAGPVVEAAPVVTVHGTASQPAPSPASVAAPPAADRRAIAVLPFENMSSDTGDYFGDGISEEIINALAQLPELRVAGRTSAFSFKGRNEDLRVIGRALNVGTVLEGSVRHVGQRVRITAQLIDAESGYHLWSERYDRDMHDILHVQDEIARAIAETLAVRLGARAAAPLVAAHPDDPDAYRSFLVGRHHLSKMTDSGFARAIEAFNAAIRRVPDYAQAWAALADAEMIRGLLMDEPYDQSPSRAAAALDRAFELDGRMAEAHATRGGMQTYYELDWEGAEQSFLRALELNPGSAWAHTWYGDLLAWTGRLDEAIGEAYRAQEIEPLAGLFRWNVLQNLVVAGRLDEMEAEAERTLELFPDAYFVYFFRGLAAWIRRDEDAAIAGVQQAVDTLGPVPIVTSQLAAIYYFFDRAAEGDLILEQVRERARAGHVSAGAFVTIHAARGDVDEAVSWLQAGRQRRDGYFCQLGAFVCGPFMPVHPRIAEEMRRVGFRQESRAILERSHD
jgi:adenylate cyclase